jgi:flavin-binding protein dodecin
MEGGRPLSDLSAVVSGQRLTAECFRTDGTLSASGAATANEALKNVEGAWVKEQKVIVKNGKISEYRVDLKVTFILID